MQKAYHFLKVCRIKFTNIFWRLGAQNDQLKMRSPVHERSLNCPAVCYCGVQANPWYMPK